mgnify:CR=1 FL=1
MAKLQFGVNDLATVRPKLASQLVDPSLATTVAEFSDKKLLWFCETGHPRHEWKAKVSGRSSGSGCGVCAGKAVLVGWNDLATVRPDLAEQLVDPSLAETVTKSSGKKLSWFCETGHPRREWEATVNDRYSGSGCGVCAGKAVLVGWNDLATVRPDLAEQLVDPSLAETVTKSSDKKLLWFCEANHPRYEWETAVSKRSRGAGCWVCAGKVVIPGWNDLGTVNPDLAKQLVNPSLAETVTKSSNKKLLWFCETGHPRREWEATVFHRSNGTGCGVCAGRAVLPGWNDLGTVRPDLSAQLVDPSEAETVTEFSMKKLLWFCATGHPRHEWEATVASRSSGHGCPTCAKSGYDSSKPGVFYRFTFVEHGERFQVYGITNNWEKRQKNYKRELKNKTWKMSDIQTLYFDDGKIPQQIESDFNKIRTPLLDEVLPSQSGIGGTIKESFSLSPENWELATVFAAHWIEAKDRAD